MGIVHFAAVIWNALFVSIDSASGDYSGHFNNVRDTFCRLASIVY